MTAYFHYLPSNYITFIIINLMLSSVVVLLEKKNPTTMLAWLFFLNIVPGFGFVFYILLSQNISKRKIFKYTNEEANIQNMVLKRQRKTILNKHFMFNSPAVERHKDLILFHNKLSNALFSQNNRISTYSDGYDKFEALFNDIKQSKKHIHILYYIIKNDDLGKKLFTLLEQKAKEGVEVRLLVDQFGGRSITSKKLKALKAAGVKFAFFFPSFSKYINFHSNYRNHRKIVVIDGEIAYIGGFNVGNEYLGLNKRFGYWRDTHIRIIGDAVFSLQLRFILDWRNATKEYIATNSRYMPNMPDLNVEKVIHHHTEFSAIQIVDSGPDDTNQQIKQGYLQIIHSAKKYIYIQSPYFIPDDSILEGLKIAASSGVDVRIMIPNKPDHPFVYWATYSFCGELIPYGVKIYTYEKGFLHSKTIVSDDDVCCVGTCNFDIRSFSLNFEVTAFIYDKEQALTMKDLFLDDLSFCHEVTPRRYKNRTNYIKIKESVSRLFSPIL